MLEQRSRTAKEMARHIRDYQTLCRGRPPEVLDVVSNEVGADMLTMAAEAEARELTEIDDALERIESGSYGACEECGGEIGKARLQAMPYASLCVQCKREQERSGGISSPSSDATVLKVAASSFSLDDGAEDRDHGCALGKAAPLKRFAGGEGV